MSHPRSVLALALGLVLAAGAGWSGLAEAAGNRKRPRGRPRAAAAAPAPVRVGAAAGPAARPAASPLGSVQFVTGKRAYLDRGTTDGLAVGQALTLSRAGRGAGACTVESASEHSATCLGGRARVGDTFRSPRPRRAQAQRRAPTLAPVVDEDTLVTRAAVISAGPIDKVEFTGKRAFRGHRSAEVTPSFTTWFSQADPEGGSYTQERIDGAIRGVELASTGLRFDGSFSAIRWSAPPGLERFRPGTPTQFYLWEAEASRRSQEGGTTLAVGRLWPFHAPGLTLLDGLQLGRQSQDGTAEGGLYGGLIPTAAGLSPSFDIRTGGIYGAVAQVGTRRSVVRLAREEARIGVWQGTSAGMVGEGEGFAQAWIGPVTVGGGTRLRWASQVESGPAVEHAHLDLGLRPSLESALGVHLRYVGARLLPDAPLRSEIPLQGGAMHAIADLHLGLSPNLALAFSAGGHRESVSGLHQFHGGAEARLPRLFRRAGGVSLGAQVEQGWMQGGAVYAQIVGRWDERMQLLARLSADGTRFQTPAAAWNLQELGGYFSADGALAGWLRLRAWFMWRAPFQVQGAVPAGVSFGGAAGLSLAGSL